MAENLTTVRGNVYKTGDIEDGTGFQVVKDKTGVYNVIFDTGTFAGTPTVVGTVISDSAEDDNTRYNCVVKRTDLKPASFVMITGDNDGDLSDRDFGFIAMGPPGA